MAELRSRRNLPARAQKQMERLTTRRLPDGSVNPDEIKPSRPDRIMRHGPLHRDLEAGLPEGEPIPVKRRSEVLRQFRDLVRRAETARLLMNAARREQIAMEHVLANMEQEWRATEVNAADDLEDDDEEPTLQNVETEEVPAEILEMRQAVAKQRVETIKAVKYWYAEFIRAKTGHATADGEGGTRWVEGINDMYERYGRGLVEVHDSYIEEGVEFYRFTEAFSALAAIEREIAGFTPPIEGFIPRNQAERKKHARAMEVMDQVEPMSDEEWREYIPLPGEEEQFNNEDRNALELLREVFGDDAAEVAAMLQEDMTEFQRAIDEGVERPEVQLGSLAALQQRQQELLAQCEEMWENAYIRNAWMERYIEGLVKAVHRGDRVLELPSVIKLMNQIAALERKFRDTTVGAVLVGEPGVGKTTVIEHYLELKGRPKPVVIDMSEEVDRYTWFGSPDISLESPIDKYRKFREITADMDKAQLLKMIQRNAKDLAGAFHGYSDDEREVIAAERMLEQLEAMGSGAELGDADERHLDSVRKMLVDICDNVIVDETAQKLRELTKKNGWRDGVVTQAIREGRSLLIDEFNMGKKWTLFHRLLQTKPGGKFRLDSGEELTIPEDWRIYFTGNIGGKHGGAPVKEALASRIGGKVIEVGNPPASEVWTAMVCMISSENARVLRGKKDLAQLGFLIHEVFPKIREVINDQSGVIQLSYRILHDLADELIDRDNNLARVDVSLDQAVFHQLVRSYALWADRIKPQQIARHLIDAGFLLDPAIEDEVVAWSGISKDELQQKRDAREGQDWDKVYDEMRSQHVSAMTAQMPAALTI